MDREKTVLSNAFGWLFIGLLLCFGVSYVSTNQDIYITIFGAFGGYAALIYAILELALAIFLSIRITKMKPLTAKIVYLLYTALTGLSFSGIFIVYTSVSIALVFLAAALIFGIFALVGKYSNVDLTKWSTYLLISLFIILILEIVNIFLLNNTLNIILCIVGIVIFAGYTAYDIKRALTIANNDEFPNAGIYCAFQLFLDFVNIFIDLLRLFGKRND